MKVLITGFDPFGGESTNPAWEAVRLLPCSIAGASILPLALPTSFGRSVPVLTEAISRYQPDIVLSVGQAGGRACITLERVALNLAQARIPDNDGWQPQEEPLLPEGPPAYYATIPLSAAVEAVRTAGLPCHISNSAGTYVCNTVMYHALHLCTTQYPRTKAGFIHVPYLPSQAVDKPYGTASMALTDIVRALEAIITAAAEAGGNL